MAVQASVGFTSKREKESHRETPPHPTLRVETGVRLFIAPDKSAGCGLVEAVFFCF
jgi:hypothetical protein